MDLIPFENTWPYEKMGEDIYIEDCPYCEAKNVLTYMTPEDLENAMDEIKTTLIMPCCHTSMTIVKADSDYFWTTDPLRKRGNRT